MTKEKVKTQPKSADGKAKDLRQFLEKIVVNAGVGRLAQISGFEEKGLVQISRDLGLIAGQKPRVCRAKQSIAGFKIRQGQIIGLQVTLRGAKMVDFFERLIRIVLPRVHDFRGIDPKAVDRGGTLNIGFKEQFVFPEVNPEESPLIFSLGVNIVSRRRGRDVAKETYSRLGVPFKK